MDKEYSSRPEKAGTVVDELIDTLLNTPSERALNAHRRAREMAALTLAEITNAYEAGREAKLNVEALAQLRKAFELALRVYRDACRDYFEHEALVEEYAAHQVARSSGLRVSLDCMDRGQACSACDGCDHECHGVRS